MPGRPCRDRPQQRRDVADPASHPVVTQLLAADGEHREAEARLQSAKEALDRARERAVAWLADAATSDASLAVDIVAHISKKGILAGPQTPGWERPRADDLSSSCCATLHVNQAGLQQAAAPVFQAAIPFVGVMTPVAGCGFYPQAVVGMQAQHWEYPCQQPVSGGLVQPQEQAAVQAARQGAGAPPSQGGCSEKSVDVLRRLMGEDCRQASEDGCAGQPTSASMSAGSQAAQKDAAEEHADSSGEDQAWYTKSEGSDSKPELSSLADALLQALQAEDADKPDHA